MTLQLNIAFFIGLARAFAGAILFSLPLLLTMEMWTLGFAMQPLRLGLLIVAAVPMLAGLAYYSGFEQRLSLKGALVDAFVAYAVGFINATLVLTLIGVIHWGMSPSEALGMLTLQAIPGAFGAVLAASQLGDNPNDPLDSEASRAGNGPPGDKPAQIPHQQPGYFRELFLMVAGALFLAFNVAPTEEMELAAYKMTAWLAILLALVSILSIHAFVYGVKFQGQERKPEEHSWWSVFLRFTLVGYALALLVSLYCLWTFNHVDTTSFAEVLVMAVVLGFPAALGAAAARLIL